VGISNGGGYVALAGESNVAVFESPTGKIRFSPKGLKGVTSVDLTPNGHYLAASSYTEVSVFDVERSGLAWKRSSIDKPVSTILFSPDGEQLAAGGEAPELRLFRTETGVQTFVPFKWNEKECRETRAPCGVRAISFSRDGRYAIVSATDKTVRVMDIKAGRELHVLYLADNVISAALTEDARFVAAASGDFKGRVFEVATGKEVWRTSLSENDFFPLGFTADNRYLIRATGLREEMLVEHDLWRRQDLQGLTETACDLVVGRNLTQEEWGRLFTEKRPQTCPKLPLLP
jgi:WD40 repeat protein